jgi:hypothetical protein
MCESIAFITSGRFSDIVATEPSIARVSGTVNIVSEAITAVLSENSRCRATGINKNQSLNASITGTTKLVVPIYHSPTGASISLKCPANARGTPIPEFRLCSA